MGIMEAGLVWRAAMCLLSECRCDTYTARRLECRRREPILVNSHSLQLGALTKTYDQVAL